MTLKEEGVAIDDPGLKDIRAEDDQDEIPQDKKILIEMHQKKFQGF
jgi:hypothetical protein